MLSASPRLAARSMRHTGAVFALGFPSALDLLLSCLSNITVNNLASGYGDIPIAAMGIVKKIAISPLKVGMDLGQGMMPLVAYNYAARNIKRIRSVICCARICGMKFAVL